MKAVAELTGDRWVFPSPLDARRPLSCHAVVNLWKRLAPKAGVPNGQRFGWHSFRRAFANTSRDVALRDLLDLGGWTTARTVVGVYQRPSDAAQRRALGALTGGLDGAGSGDERAPGTGTTPE